MIDGQGGDAGWCTYEGHLEDAPDVEVMCGGKNSKLPTAAAIWRQGNLLHFGFEQDPEQFNATGRNLLENSIVYAAKFAGNPPLGVVPSGFVTEQRPELRRYIPAVVDSERATSEGIANRFFSGELRERLAAMPLPDVRTWVHGHEDWLVAGPDGKFVVDEALRRLATRADTVEFFATVRRALTGDRRQDALAVLPRYVPSGPGADAGADEWRTFLEQAQPYLFYSESAGYVWLLDPVAQRRGVPSAELRGGARANRLR